MTSETVLIAGDVHGDTVHMKYLINKAFYHDIVKIMVVGDFGAWEHTADGREFFDNTDLHASQRDIIVYFIDGNHDKTSLVVEMYSDSKDEQGFLKCRENLRYAPRGHRWTWGESRCIALGGAYSVDKGWRIQQEREKTLQSKQRTAHYGATPKDFSGTLWFPEEEMTDEELDSILSVDSSPVDIIFSHDKPRAASVPWNRKDLSECWPNQDRIQKAVKALRPHHVYHGHLHYPYETGIFIGEGPNEWVTVVGLDCGQEGYHPGYYRRDSWIAVEL